MPRHESVCFTSLVEESTSYRKRGFSEVFFSD
jgi:hypothetical protein